MSGPIHKPMPPVPSCMSGPLIEPAPLVKQFDGGGVFQGAGNSHFTHDNNGFHVTTEIPGLKQGCRITDTMNVNDMFKK